MTAGAGANGLLGMLPYAGANGVLSTLTRSGSDVQLELLSIKGVVYAQFPAQSGSYVATYTSGGTSPPAIIQRTPAPGATGVAVNTTIAVTFNKPMMPSSISAQSIELRDGSGALVPVSVVYSAPTTTATLSPSAALAFGTTYTVTVKGGTSGNRVLDAAGNTMLTDVSWTFTTLAGQSCPCSGWDPTFVPANPDSNDTGSVELGVKFRSDVAGQVTGVRFYKSAANTGTHVGKLWSSSGQLLGSVTFSNETASGWQQANFSAPITIAANTVYVISYFAPNGHYAFAAQYFTSAGVDRPPLHMLRDGDSGGNGVYAYGSGGFPSSSFQATNYFVDVVFSSVGGGPDTVAPSVALPIRQVGRPIRHLLRQSLWRALHRITSG